MRKLLLGVALMLAFALAPFAPARADTVAWPPPGTTPSVSWTWTCSGGIVVHADNQPYETDYRLTVDGIVESSGTIGAANLTVSVPQPTSHDPSVAHTGVFTLTPQSTGVTQVTNLSIGVCQAPCDHDKGHGDHHGDRGDHHGDHHGDGDHRRHH